MLEKEIIKMEQLRNKLGDLVVDNADVKQRYSAALDLIQQQNIVIYEMKEQIKQ